MITTVTTTTTTTTTTVVAAQFATIAGIVAVVALIVFLVVKELLSSAGSDESVAVESGFAGKAKLLADKANIAIYSLIFVFVAIVLTKIIEVIA